jgi:hypothetical protein
MHACIHNIRIQTHTHTHTLGPTSKALWSSSFTLTNADLHKCVYVYVCMHAYVCMYMCVYIYMSDRRHLGTLMHTRIPVCVHTCIHVSVCMCALWLCTHVCMYACMYVNVCIQNKSDAARVSINAHDHVCPQDYTCMWNSSSHTYINTQTHSHSHTL